MVAFKDEVGKVLTRNVSIWQPDPSEAPVVGFGVEGKNRDSLLLGLRTPAEVAEEEEKAQRARERYLDMDYVPTDYGRRYSRRDAIDPKYGSLRMYHLNGNPPVELVDRDEWEVRVAKCYFNPGEKLTEDGRRKIHYSVDLVSRIESVTRQCFPNQNLVRIERRCGPNFRSENVECDIRPARYRVDSVLEAVVTAEKVTFEVDGKEESLWQKIKITTFSDIIKEQQQTIGRGFDVRRVRRDYEALPPAPKSLLESIGK